MGSHPSGGCDKILSGENISGILLLRALLAGEFGSAHPGLL
jgi:hypothetical protein